MKVLISAVYLKGIKEELRVRSFKCYRLVEMSGTKVGPLVAGTKEIFIIFSN